MLLSLAGAGCRGDQVAEPAPAPPAVADVEPTAATPSFPAELFGVWIHAREEDTDDVHVYRPRGHPLPPARGRDGFELFADGRARLLSPGPNDAGASEEGRWEALDEHTLRILGDEGSERLRLTLVEVSPERLQARVERGR